MGECIWTCVEDHGRNHGVRGDMRTSDVRTAESRGSRACALVRVYMIHTQTHSLDHDHTKRMYVPGVDCGVKQKIWFGPEEELAVRTEGHDQQCVSNMENTHLSMHAEKPFSVWVPWRMVHLNCAALKCLSRMRGSRLGNKFWN